MTLIYELSATAARRLLLSIMCLTLASLPSFGQGLTIVLPNKNVTIEEAFAEIENQSDFLVSVNYAGFDASRKVRLSKTSLEINQLLQQLLAGTNRGYLIRGNHILVIPQEERSSMIAEGMQQTATEVPPTVVTRHPSGNLSSNQTTMTKLMEAKGYKRPALNETAYVTEKNESGGYYSGLPSYTSGMPVIAVRTNLLYDAGALTPNLGVEIGLARRFTLELAGGYNDWKKDNGTEYKRLSHWIGHIEGRYWFCERFNGHFVGLHGYYSQYKIAGHKIPFLFDDDDAKQRMYDGSIYGAGISYGYQFMLGKRWNLELTAGAGFGVMEYDKYECERCGDLVESGVKKTVFTPTKLGVSLIFIIK